MGSNNQKTKSFATTGGKKKGFKNKKARQRLVTAIFVVIILILLALSTLIIGKIMTHLNRPTPTLPPNNDTVQIYKDAGDVHIGSLVLVNSTSPFNYEINGMTDVLNATKPEESVLPESLVNLWLYKFQNPESEADTKITIPGTTTKIPTYNLGTLAVKTVLHKDALGAFNKMLLDYCGTLDLTAVNGESASGINVAWGWSDSKEIESDVKDDPNSPFYDHSTGMTLTLRDSHNQIITEESFKNNYEWLYNNAYKYGFVIRYTSECGCGRENAAIRLRYVGYEHAYYMTQNNLCLEEYLTLIREHHKYSGEHLTFTADNGKTYEIYYVACTGDPTNISVPKNAEYTISGDNMNGFIVTVVK